MPHRGGGTQVPTAVSRSPLPNSPFRGAHENEELTGSFAADYFRRWSSENSQALAYVSDVYAPLVVFYGKPTPRVAVLKQKRAYVARWPSRSYVLRPGSSGVTCDEGGSECTVSGLVDWDCASVERGAHSVGTAEFTFRLRFVGGRAAIVAESGTVVARAAAR